MKEYASHFLRAVAIAYMSFPISYLVVTAIAFGIPPGELLSVLLSPLFYFVCFWSVLSGFALWEMKRWAWYVFVFANFLIVYENAYLVVTFGQTPNKIFAFLISIVCISIILWRIRREIKVPYILPRIRWWESSQEFKFSVPVQLLLDHTQARYAGTILDLSPQGCFIRSEDELELNSKVKLDFNIFGQGVFCVGTVVWRTAATVTHPKGLGIKFELLDKTTRRRLKIAAKRLKGLWALQKKSAGNADEILQRVESLQRAFPPSDGKTS